MMNTDVRRDYVYGNAARELDVRTAIRERSRRDQLHLARKNRERAKLMNPGYVLFLASMLVVAGFVLAGYLRLQSDITTRIKTVSRLESQLNDLRLSNDEAYNRVISGVNLEKIKKIAINELGMRYAREGQIVVYESEGSDYVRQVADVPE